MEKTTVEVQIGWIEGLIDLAERINTDAMIPSAVYPFAALLGYITSAKTLLPKAINSH